MHCKGRTFFIYNQILRQNFGYSLLFSYLCSENRTKGTVPVVRFERTVALFSTIESPPRRILLKEKDCQAHVPAYQCGTWAMVVYVGVWACGEPS